MMTGAKYDAKPLVTSLREGVESAGVNSEDAMIHGALMPGRPATAIISTLSSERPLRPYVFRSYQLPPGIKGLFEGQCRYSWLEALRASSAAPYFFEEFSLGASLRFQDGAIVANNPTIVALQEAQSLWPGRPIDCVVSVGTGKCPSEISESRSMYSPLSMMVEAALSTERVAEAMETLAPLIPGASFFRLQVEDRRMAAEIDDISCDVRTGLCEGVAEYIQSNESLFREIASALMEAEACNRQFAGEAELEQDGGATNASDGAAALYRQVLEPRQAAKKTRRKMGLGAGIHVAVVETMGGCGEGLFYPKQPGALDAATRSARGDASELVVYLQQEMGLSAELLCVSPYIDAAASASSTVQTQPVLPAVIEGLARTRANVVHFGCTVGDEGLIASWQRSPLVISLSDALNLIKSASAHYPSHPNARCRLGFSPNMNESPQKSCAVDVECPISPFAGPAKRQTSLIGMPRHVEGWGFGGTDGAQVEEAGGVGHVKTGAIKREEMTLLDFLQANR